jgi:hypothetical protein
MSTPDDETRREVQAALAARRELGMEYEEAIAAGLLDRVNQLGLMRAGDLRREADQAKDVAKAERDSRHQRFVLGIVSVGAGIPITAITAALVEPDVAGLLVSWAGIVGVNVAAALRGRRPPTG